MMDSTLSRAERSLATAGINSDYSEQMEEMKEAMDVKYAFDEASPLGKLRVVAGGVAIPLRIYGKARYHQIACSSVPADV
jgi:hypothetical protein